MNIIYKLRLNNNRSVGVGMALSFQPPYREADLRTYIHDA